MNKLTNIFEARRRVRNVDRIRISSNAFGVRDTPRRPLICTWTIDPASGRLIGSWSKPPCEDNYAAARDAHGHAPSEIPIAA